MMHKSPKSGHFARIVTIFLVGLFAVNVVMAGSEEKNRTKFITNSPSGLWEQIDEAEIRPTGDRFMLPEKSVTFRLDRNLLKGILSEMPREFSDEARRKEVIIEMPMPYGGTSRFRIEESDLLGPQTLKDFPTWKTFPGLWH